MSAPAAPLARMTAVAGAHPPSVRTAGPRTRRDRVPRSRAGRAPILACFSVLLGAAILVLAVPRVMAAFWLWLRAPVMDLVIYQEPVSAADLYGLIASRELALGWSDAGAVHGDLASALSMLASLQQPESETERGLLEQAIGAAQAGLALAPADPRGWTRLAYLRTLLTAEPDPQAARALQLSLRSGPYDRPDFLALRLSLLLLHWPVMTEPERARVGGQIRLLWREAPDELVRLAVEAGFADLILAALEDAPIVKSQLLDAMRDGLQAN